MSRIHEFFQNQPEGSEKPSRQHFMLLGILGQMNQDELLTPENIEKWSERGNPRRTTIKKAMKNRIFKKLLEFHEKIGNGTPMTFPYALWISGISERATDVYLYHSHSIYRAKEDSEPEISLGFWSNRVCPGGLWKSLDWKARWKAQKQDKENLLENEEEWEIVHAMEFENETGE